MATLASSPHSQAARGVDDTMLAPNHRSSQPCFQLAKSAQFILILPEPSSRMRSPTAQHGLTNKININNTNTIITTLHPRPPPKPSIRNPFVDTTPRHDTKPLSAHDPTRESVEEGRGFCHKQERHATPKPCALDSRRCCVLFGQAPDHNSWTRESWPVRAKETPERH